MSFLHGLPLADGPGGGVEVDSHLDELPPVGGVRDQVATAECLPVGTAFFSKFLLWTFLFYVNH